METSIMVADKNETKRREDDSHEKLVNDIINEIDNNIYAVKSVEQLARDYSISSGHIKNIFKKHTGITIFEYLFEKRMNAAKDLLDNTDLKVYEIAEKLGYKSKAFFSRAFQKQIGITPSQYRKRNK